MAPLAQACLWDRDTVAAEAKAHPGLVEIITGRFERNPPAYYEARLDRVASELRADPNRLDLYDDAAVACDRLHRPEEALAWLAEKREAIERLPDSTVTTDHRYRYHANLGTVLAHRWLRAGAKPETLSEMRAAREEIARALALNPEAHFGREKYQLMAMDWILAMRSNQSETVVARGSDPRSFIEFGRHSKDREATPMSRLPPPLKDAIDGVSGLIRLGDAWQSVDVFYALQTALQADGASQLALLAEWRRDELETAGAKSLFPAPAEDFAFTSVPFVQHWEESAKTFRQARAEADAWNDARTRFIEEQVARGRHPDTHSDFWKSFVYRSHPPSFEAPLGLKGALQRLAQLPVLLALSLISLLVVQIIRLARRRRAYAIPGPETLGDAPPKG